MKLGLALKLLLCYQSAVGSGGLSLSSVVETESTLVRQQLGYTPSNFLSISAWTLDGKEPVAFKTYPLQGGAKRRQRKADRGNSISSPFPTLYWLSCPEISSAIADLERRGFIQDFEKEIKIDEELRDRLRKCHEEYAAERWNTITDEDREMLCSSPSFVRMRNMMEHSGISGSNFTVSHKTEDDISMFMAPIKCLHAHYAQYRSTMSCPELTKNPVGEMIHEALTQEFPDLNL